MTTTAASALAGLARASNNKIVTLAEMTAVDILAGLTDEQRAELSASLAPTPAPNASAAHPEPDSTEPDGDPDDSKCAKCKEPMKDGKCAKCESAAASSDASQTAPGSFAAANQRAMAVMGSEHFAANMALAKTLMANDKLSADEICAALAVAGPGSGGGDPDAAARAVMLEAIRSNANSNVSPVGGPAPEGQGASASIASGWSKAAAKANAAYRL